MQLSPGHVAEVKNIIYNFFCVEKNSPTLQGIYIKFEYTQLLLVEYLFLSYKNYLRTNCTVNEKHG